MIDMHVHSTFSDGSFTPAELVTKSKEIGLTALALTDHDSTGGLDLFLDGCVQRESGKELIGIPGVEISADVKRGTMHILGYFIDHRDAGLQSVLERIRDGRKIRNEEILKKLAKLGLPLASEEVAAFAEEEVVGRPHFAQAMLARGWVSSTQEAFELYLKKGKPAYADRFRMSPTDSIAAILAARGVPVLAHPITLELDSNALKRYTAELKEIGLQGIEVFYSEHSPAHVQAYLALARELGLVATGGTDFHGAINPAIRLGVGFGSLRVPDQIVDELRAQRDRNAVRGSIS